MRRVLPLVLVGGGLLLAAGCGRNSDLVPVSGRVTLDGKPVKGLIVNFQPLGDTKGNGALSLVGEDGRFTLSDMRGGSGAHVGEYKVSFYPSAAGTKADDPADVVSTGLSGGVPRIYLDPARTPLQATVPPGGGTIEVTLTRSGKGAETKTTPKGEGK